MMQIFVLILMLVTLGASVQIARNAAMANGLHPVVGLVGGLVAWFTLMGILGGLLAIVDADPAYAVFVVVVLGVWACCGWLGYIIGKSKNRAAAGTALGAALGVVGIAILLCLPEEGLRCPTCFGVVRSEARMCRHCGSTLPWNDKQAANAAPTEASKRPTMTEPPGRSAEKNHPPIENLGGWG